MRPRAALPMWALCVVGCAAPVEAAPTPSHALHTATQLIAPHHEATPMRGPSPEPAPVATDDSQAAAPVGPDAGSPEPAPEPESTPQWPAARWSSIVKFRSLVERHAATYLLDPDLLCALIWVESKFNPKARGPSGARGLMQIMPGTGKHLAKKIERKYAPYDADFSIESGAYLLRRLLDRFGGDEELALAGYNRGGGTVAHWVAQKEALPEGTRKFVDKVLSARTEFSHTTWPEPAAKPSPKP